MTLSAEELDKLDAKIAEDVVLNGTARRVIRMAIAQARRAGELEEMLNGRREEHREHLNQKLALKVENQRLRAALRDVVPVIQHGQRNGSALAFEWWDKHKAALGEPQAEGEKSDG